MAQLVEVCFFAMDARNYGHVCDSRFSPERMHHFFFYRLAGAECSAEICDVLNASARANSPSSQSGTVTNSNGAAHRNASEKSSNSNGPDVSLRKRVRLEAETDTLALVQQASPSQDSPAQT